MLNKMYDVIKFLKIAKYQMFSIYFANYRL